MTEFTADLIATPEALPVLPLRDTIVYPTMTASLVIGQPRSLQLLNDVLKGGRLVAAVVQKDPEHVPAGPEDLYVVGTLALLH